MSKLILGDGLLGSYLVENTDWNYVSRKKDNIDFTNVSSYAKLIDKYDTIINCIGKSDCYENNKSVYWNINYKGVADLVDLCNDTNKKLVHISSDYVYAKSKPFASEDDVPVHCRNWYGYTKLLADGYIELRSDDYLIVRTSFKNDLVHKDYKYGWMQFGNFDFVNIIGDMIIDIINLNVKGIYNIGTKTKTLYDLFSVDNDSIKPTFNYPHESVPSNVTMNLNKIRSLYERD
jgi:dTDP-4-dehydrorhamnose reductase